MKDNQQQNNRQTAVNSLTNIIQFVSRHESETKTTWGKQLHILGDHHVSTAMDRRNFQKQRQSKLLSPLLPLEVWSLNLAKESASSHSGSGQSMNTNILMQFVSYTKQCLLWARPPALWAVLCRRDGQLWESLPWGIKNTNFLPPPQIFWLLKPSLECRELSQKFGNDRPPIPSYQWTDSQTDKQNYLQARIALLHHSGSMVQQPAAAPMAQVWPMANHLWLRL